LIVGMQERLDLVNDQLVMRRWLKAFEASPLS